MVSRRAILSCSRVLAVIVTACAGCTSLLGIDEDYALKEDRGPIVGGGGTSSGGADAAPASGGSSGGSSGGATGGNGTGGNGTGGTLPGTGGVESSGGQGTGGDVPDAGGCASSCSSSQKCCGGMCVPVSPLWGCSPTLCGPCSSLPENAVGICDGEACSFECVSHYEKSEDGTRCEPIAGTGGQTGAGGSSPVCEPQKCTGCGSFLYTPCCQRNGVCGCAWPGAPCFPRTP